MTRKQRKLSDHELFLARLERRKHYPVPAWSDHVLRGFQGLTTAKPVTATRQAA